MIRNIASGVRLGRMTGAMRRAVSSFVICHSSFFILHFSLIISLTALAACSSDSGEEQRPVVPTPEPVVPTEVAISFSGHEEEGKTVDTGSTRAETRAGTPLSEMGVTQFNVWGYKNMGYTEPNYDGKQEVFPGYIVKWLANSAATTTTNSSGWEYILLDPADQTIKYWDWAAKAYRFFAVTNWSGDLPADPGDYDVNKTYGADNTNSYEITMLANCSGADKEAIATNMDNTPFFSHLWFSTDELPTYADKRFGKPVQLEFLKPYARVRFIFKYSYPREGIKLTKTIFKPTDGSEICRKGTFTVSYPMTGAATSESYTVTPEAVATTYTAVANGTTLTSGKTYYTSGSGAGEFVSNGSEVADGTNYFTLTNKKLEAFTEDCDPEDDSKVYTETDGGWYYVLPNLSQGAYKMAVWMNADDVSAEASRTAVVPAEYMRWLPGYSYTYIFKILEEGGVEIELVQAAVTPWTDMEADHEVYNW